MYTFLAAGPLACPVEGIQGQAKINIGLRVNFLFRRMQASMVIISIPWSSCKIKTPHPRCPQLDMLVIRSTLNKRYLNTAKSAKGVDRKRRSMDAE